MTCAPQRAKTRLGYASWPADKGSLFLCSLLSHSRAKAKLLLLLPFFLIFFDFFLPRAFFAYFSWYSYSSPCTVHEFLLPLARPFLQIKALFDAKKEEEKEKEKEKKKKRVRSWGVFFLSSLLIARISRTFALSRADQLYNIPFTPLGCLAAAVAIALAVPLSRVSFCAAVYRYVTPALLISPLVFLLNLSSDPKPSRARFFPSALQFPAILLYTYDSLHTFHFLYFLPAQELIYFSLFCSGLFIPGAQTRILLTLTLTTL